MRTKTQNNAGRIVLDYFNAEIAQSRDRVSQLVLLSKRHDNPDMRLEYLLQAGAERKRNARWSYWQALQVPDAAYRSAACATAIKLLEEAYPRKSEVGFRILHPFISGKLGRLNAELNECIRELKRSDAA